MNKRSFEIRYLLYLLLMLLPFSNAWSQDSSNISGIWQLIPDESSPISLYKTINLRVKQTNSRVEIVQTWESQFPYVDSFNIGTDGHDYQVPVNSRVSPSQVMSGISMVLGSEKEISATWIDPDKILQVTEKYPVLVSQGETAMNGVRIYSLSNEGQKLTLSVYRNFDKSNMKTYTFRRGKEQTAYFMKLQDGWEVKSSLAENAFLISLQGIANTDSAHLYFIYPDDYDYNFTDKLFDYYKNHLGYSFTQIRNERDALNIFKKYVKGYIVWDPMARASLNVAFTLAGLKKAVVVSPDMLPLVRAAGLKEIADFRGKFIGKNDAEVYKWAYDHYWPMCNKEYIVWMGGVSGPEMKPGIADFGISKGCFFADLSTDPKDSTEYALASKILGGMKPLSMVMGWHSYAKDLERNYVTLASHYALRVEGLNTFPDLSFTSRTPPPPGFKFKNNPHIVPHGVYIPKKKVYIALVQSDGLGLGAWNDQERGSIPYAWEVTINWQWMAPVLLEYYYSHATPNDFFIGSLSGPGYMYPKAVPPDLLPAVIKKADEISRKLDLNVFETMDYSQGSTVTGNTNLPEYIVNDYYKYMPDMIGFINGYTPSFTFDSDDGRPFISYDYYLDEHLPIEDAVTDLKQLIDLNKKRPYFLLVHVREFNSMKRVQELVNGLGPNVEVVPLDVFLKLAGNTPTFKTRFLNGNQ